MKKSKVKKIIFNFLLMTIIALLLIIDFIKKYFPVVDIEQIVFHMSVPLNSNSGDFINEGLSYVFPKFLIILFFYIILVVINKKITFQIKFKRRRKVHQYNMNNILIKMGKILTLVLFLFLIYDANKTFSIYETIKFNLNKTNLYEEKYITPSETTIRFPSNKKNLIYIIVESLEIAEFSEKNGGYRESSIIPQLENIALKNINFSNTEKLGGFYHAGSTGYTAAAIVAQTAGIPLTGGLGGNNYDQYESVLNYTESIGDVLADNGYNNYFMMGSDKKFGGRANYLESHNYTIFDFYSAIKQNYIDEDYDIGWWGFEDKKLYDFAKEKLDIISKEDKPFNLTLLTVDTHPLEGYLDETCAVNDDLTKFENVFKCGNEMLNEFINWIKRQDFYKDTTIIIVGDHINMTNKNIHDEMPEDYHRTVYNAFINSSAKTNCDKNRIFTHFDIFPTTLASLGVEIEGERLALGTNLFSCEKTIAEEIGLTEFRNELSKKSNFYNNCLFFGIC